jgi:hypothetical protein
VAAVDPFGQSAYGYSGTVTFSTTDPDPNVVLPADYSFTPADQGTHTFSGGVTLITPGDQTITATDTSDATVPGSATVTVTGGGGAPGPHRAADSADAVFAVLAPEGSWHVVVGTGVGVELENGVAQAAAAKTAIVKSRRRDGRRDTPIFEEFDTQGHLRYP